jgi:hypothetical protein
MHKNIRHVPEILKNSNNTYQGNLRAYFKIIIDRAKNLNNGYHNLRHLLHVLWNCYQAIVYHASELTLRQARNILIAAMFHDFDHTGRSGNDDDNIIIAIKGLRKHILEEDKDSLLEIERLMHVTRFPYLVSLDENDLCGKILRDADLTQAFSPAWIQQVVFGLAEEWQTTPLAVLKMQASFLGGLTFLTKWAQSVFTPAVIQEKINEANAYVALLEEK